MSVAKLCQLDDESGIAVPPFCPDQPFWPQQWPQQRCSSKLVVLLQGSMAYAADLWLKRC